MQNDITLVTDRKLVQELNKRLDTEYTVTSIRLMRFAGRIPFVRLGYRTLRYDVERVIRALTERREVRARR